MNRLTAYRNRNSISQATFAEKLGITQSQLSKLERGETAIKAEMAVAVEQLTGGNVSRFDWPVFEPLRPEAI